MATLDPPVILLEAPILTVLLSYSPLTLNPHTLLVEPIPTPPPTPEYWSIS